MIINLVFLDLLAGNVFDLEVQYGNVRAVLHQITIEVVSVWEVLLAELSEPCGSLVLILDDAQLAEADDALDMEPLAVFLFHGFIYENSFDIHCKVTT
jgi:hypothetical protein